jgi:hypothetical protein
VESRSKKGKVPPPLGGPNSKTFQIINIWKSDSSFQQLVLSSSLGEAVAKLGGWEGARVANDQVHNICSLYLASYLEIY